MSHTTKCEWEDLAPQAQQSAFNTWFDNAYGYYDRYERELFDEIEKLLGVVIKDWAYTPSKYSLTLVPNKSESAPKNYQELLCLSEDILEQGHGNYYYNTFFELLRDISKKSVDSNKVAVGDILSKAIFEALDVMSSTAFLDNYKDEFSYESFIEFHCGEYLYNSDGQLLSPVDLVA